VVGWGSPRQLAVASQLSMNVPHFAASDQSSAEWDGLPVLVAVDGVRLSLYILVGYSFVLLF
jgi:hypothetical protein